jgi:alkylhydroperoxidase family enzyme
VTREQLENLWRFQKSPHFDDAERKTLQYTVEVTQHYRVRDETFAAAKAVLGSDRKMMEFIMSVAQFSLSSYVMIPCELDIGPGFEHVPLASEMPRPSWL